MTWYDDLKLAPKLVLAFATVAFLAGVIGWVGYQQLNAMATADTALYEKALLPVKYLGQINGDFRAQRADYYQALVARTEGAREEALKGLVEREARMQKSMEQYPTTFSDDQDRSEFAKLQDLHRAYLGIRDAAIALIRGGDAEKSAAFLAGSIYPAFVAERDQIVKMMAQQEEGAKRDADANAALAHSAIRTMIGIALAAVLLALALGFLVARSIARPVTSLVAAARRMASGDLSVDVQAGRKDEVGDLSVAFQELIGAVKRLSSDATLLVQAAQEGKLATRADASRHAGTSRRSSPASTPRSTPSSGRSTSPRGTSIASPRGTSRRESPTATPATSTPSRTTSTSSSPPRRTSPWWRRRSPPATCRWRCGRAPGGTS